MKYIIPILLVLALFVSPAQAEWEPKGPIKLWIGFGAGGAAVAPSWRPH
jgi:tripartite-type tricarboxylate transporter receptor subunit TctC